MRNASDPAPSPPQPTSPLARDEEGNPIRLPEDAAAWRIRRHTGGRPRHQLDCSKQPMLFPLHYTINDAEEILSPGTYRLDLINGKGEFLEMTVPIVVGLRNADAEEPAKQEADNENVPTRLPVSGSDVRLVLEANVRSTQLAFQHNERTLTASLRMAETLRDGVHVLAEAQADFIKSLASSRGFLRNASPPLALPPPKPDETHHEDEDEGDDEPHKDDRLMAFGMAAVTLVNNLIETFRGGGQGTKPPTNAAPSSSFDLRSLLDWRRAVPAAEPKAVETIAAPPSSPGDMLRVIGSLPPEFMSKLKEVRGLLSPDEQSKLMPLVMAFRADELPAIAAELMTRSVEEIADLFREQLAKLPKV